MKAQIKKDASLEDISLGIIYAANCKIEASSQALLQEINEAISKAKVRTDAETLKGEVRNMLRFGTYKPTGRGKPASEYLLGAAKEEPERFPRINNLVDINNLVSLESLLPISVIDIQRAGSSTFFARRGRAGESYLFNNTGQTIELRDLLLISIMPQDEPCANAVKDSMKTKIQETSQEFLAVLYAPSAHLRVLQEATRRFASLLKAHTNATDIEEKTL
jgi:DNA/RNA-binding domain of Phe-tRNA-synthetase-like protein